MTAVRASPHQNGAVSPVAANNHSSHTSSSTASAASPDQIDIDGLDDAPPAKRQKQDDRQSSQPPTDTEDQRQSSVTSIGPPSQTGENEGENGNGSQPHSGEQRAPKPKQKRNKPTLSCKECVDRKTKCDRGRPTCLACLKRSTHCQYTHIADILASSAEHDKPRKARKSKQATAVDPDRSSKMNISSITHPSGLPHGAMMQDQFVPQQYGHQQQNQHVSYASSQTSMAGTASNMRLSALAMPNNAAVDVFGMGGEHPFANYWTATGGITEVLGVLPSKEQADILVQKYFEIMDPMYPIIDLDDFMINYERFWQLPIEGKSTYAPDIIALHFVIYATSTQFLEQASPDQRTKTAEFYISAAHQALRISSYWSHITIPTVQAMAMTFYFLINDNHVSDAWTFAGITVRQAYVLQLNRDPELVVPHLTRGEKNLRLKIWQSVMHQDSAIAMFLKMPPAAITSDIGSTSYDVDAVTSDFFMQNRMDLGPFQSLSGLEERESNDMGFAKSMWIFTSFIQDNICKRRALTLPLANSNEHKRDVVSAFKGLRMSFPKPFNSLDPKRFMSPNIRLARQQISLSSNFFHSLMLLCVDENPEAKVPIDIWGTLEAAHEGLAAFFAMNDRFGGEVNGFWAYQHRAFEMAITIANLLQGEKRPPLPTTSGNSIGQAHLLLKTAKDDVRLMLEVISRSSGYFEYQHVQERRLDVLQAVFERIRIV